MSIPALETIRDTLKGTKFEHKVYLVGGYVRDRLLQQTAANILHSAPSAAADDIDLVCEGDYEELVNLLYSSGICEHNSVIYSRFRTAMLTISGCKVEIVGARKESYNPESRKPDSVSGTLEEDVFRRDFTINSLLENLYTGEILDLTTKGMKDLREKVIRTPLDPFTTFDDDPLRMMRAVRFAARFGFSLSETTFDAIRSNSHRLNIVSTERIIDEFCKILAVCSNSQPIDISNRYFGRTDQCLSVCFRASGLQVAYGLELLSCTGLLAVILPEFVEEYSPVGCIDKRILWVKSVLTVEHISCNHGFLVRLAGLFVRFQSKENIRTALRRMKLSKQDAHSILCLVENANQARSLMDVPDKRAIRELLNSAYLQLDQIFALLKAVIFAEGTRDVVDNVSLLEQSISEFIQREGHSFMSPLDGNEIMQITHCPQGAAIGKIKDYLQEKVLLGEIKAGDKEAAKAQIPCIWNGNNCRSK